MKSRTIRHHAILCAVKAFVVGLFSALIGSSASADFIKTSVVVTPPSRNPVYSVQPTHPGHPVHPHHLRWPTPPIHRWQPPVVVVPSPALPFPPIQIDPIGAGATVELPTRCQIVFNPLSGAQVGASCSAVNTTVWPLRCRIVTNGHAQFLFPGTSTNVVWYAADLVVAGQDLSLSVDLYYANVHNPLVAVSGRAVCSR